MCNLLFKPCLMFCLLTQEVDWYFVEILKADLSQDLPLSTPIPVWNELQQHLTYCRMWNTVQLCSSYTISNEKQGRVTFICLVGWKCSIKHIREYLPHAAPFPSTSYKADKDLSALISHVSYRCWHVPLLVQDHACETTQRAHRSANLPAAISSLEQNSLFSSHQSPLNLLVFRKNIEIQVPESVSYTLESWPREYH